MTGREYLESIYKLAMDRKILQCEIEEIQKSSMGLVSKYENLISGQGINGDLSGYYSRLENKIRELAQRDLELSNKRQRAIELVEGTPMRDAARRVLIYRYVYQYSFEAIEEELYMSRSLVYQRHREGVRAIERVITSYPDS